MQVGGESFTEMAILEERLGRGEGVSCIGLGKVGTANAETPWSGGFQVTGWKGVRAEGVKGND